MFVAKLIFWVSVFILFYSYIGYGIIAFCLGRLKRIFRSNKKYPTAENSDDLLPPVTLIIAAYNEAPFIREKILNAQDIDYPSSLLHIIVVTDGSTDDTPLIAGEFPKVQVLHHPDRLGKVAAINRAMDSVQTPIVIFSDANTFLNKEAVKKIVRHYEDPAVGGVAGEKKIGRGEKPNMASIGESVYWKYESLLKRADAGLHSVVGAAGELFSIRSHLFHKLDEQILLDDLILSVQITLQHYRIAYEPLAYAIETPSLSLAEEKKRKIRIAAGAFQSLQYLWPVLNFFRYPLPAFQFLSRRIFRWILSPPALIALLLSNALLVWLNAHPFYQLIFLLQLAFYTLALLGWLLPAKRSILAFFLLPFYIVFMNLCLIYGLVKYLSGTQTVLWEKARRQQLSAR
jgi:poly-beta-1,6-N-acetyl-D-glucosamine synthase